MQNDERDTPDSPSDEPPAQPSSDEANEFETASWPAQDAAPGEPAAEAKTGRIESIRVEVPGAGWP